MICRMGLLGSLGLLNILSIYAIPPPPVISIYNNGSYNGGVLEVSEDYYMRRDTEVDQIHFISVAVLNLQRHTIKVGAGGITTSVDWWGYITNGVVDSDRDFIDVNIGKSSGVFQDVAFGGINHKVGLRIHGNDSRSRITFFRKTQFLGDLEASNANFVIHDNPIFHGNISLINSNITFYGSLEISSRSIVVLDSSKLYINSKFDFVRIAKLVVERLSYVDILGRDSESFLFLDDLLITENSVLMVSTRGGRQGLLVRKDSEHLYESLSRVKIGNNHPAQLSDYSKDYWELVPNLPEPAICGAVFGAVGFGFTVWRKRRRFDRRPVVLKLHG